MAATRLVRGGQNNRIPVLAVPTVAAVAYAFWKDLTAPFTIALMIGQVCDVQLSLCAVLKCASGACEMQVQIQSQLCNCSTFPDMCSCL